MTWRSWLRSLFARPVTRTIRNAPARRPTVEALEDRLVLTTNVTVNTVAELRTAISNANVDTDDWVITLNPGTYTLTGNALDNANREGDLDINKPTGSLALNGAGAGPADTLIDGDFSDRVFHVLNGTVKFSNLTIQNGAANDDGTSADAEARGGGLLNDGGRVTLDNVVVQDNEAFGNRALVSDSPGHNGFGGGVANVGGTLTVLDSTITDNTAAGGSGDYGGPGDGLGGGLATRLGTVIVSRSLLSTNATFGGMNENVSDGSGDGVARGGGLYSENTDLTISDSTVSGNTAGGSFFAGRKAEGGGIHIQSSSTAPARIANSTIVRNSAAGCPDPSSPTGGVGNSFGGGVFSGGEASPVVVSTIVAENTVAGSTVKGPDVFGTFTSASHNLIGIGDGSTGFTNNTGGAPSDPTYEQVGTTDTPLDPVLGDLAFNGGPTQTHALLPGSPALHTGSNPDGLATDQRGSGFTRIRGGTVDIGAFEVQGAQNEPPTISHNQAALTVSEGSPASNSGTFDDAEGRDNVTLSASLGTVVKDDTTGTWSWSYTPPDNTSPTTVTITATDSGDLSASTTFTLSVNNVAPNITTFTVPPTAGEGSPVSLSAAATDPAGADDPLAFTWTITRPDSSTLTLTGASASFTPADNGSYTVSLTVSDGDGGSASQSGNIGVANVAPSIALSGAASVNEGAAYQLTLGAVTDPGQDTVSQYVVHWGDGSSDTYDTPGDKTHVYTGGGTYSISVDLVDEDGTHSNGAPLSVVVNAAPTDLALSHSSVAENQPAGTLVGTLSTTDLESGGTFRYALVSGAGDTDNASFTLDADGTLKTAAGFDFEARSSYSIRVRSTDASGLSVEKELTISVTDVNEAPELVAPSGGSGSQDAGPPAAPNSAAVPGTGVAPTTVGVFDGPAQYGDPPATWKLRHSASPGAPDITPFAYGSPTSIAVVGDWDGNGSFTIGVVDVVPNPYRPDGLNLLRWKVKNSNQAGAPDLTFLYGKQGDLPVVGDWDGDGTFTVGIFEPDTGVWKLKNTNQEGAPDYTFAYGQVGDVPVVGDWDGDGTTTVGVARPDPVSNTLTWYLRNANSPGAPDIAPFAYGARGDTPVPGDWDGDRITTVGVYEPAAAVWKLRNSNSPGAPDLSPFAYGSPDGLSQPVPGAYGAPGLLQAAGGAASLEAQAAPLSQQALDGAVQAALTRLHEAGASDAVLGRLGPAHAQVGDLPGAELGQAWPASGAVLLDGDAAGHGWFVDPTPLTDEEFDASGQALAGGPAAGRMDLLTAVLHELGHLAGLPDVSAATDPADLMGEQLGAGVRRTAVLDQVFARTPF
jgi:hypothetical protein